MSKWQNTHIKCHALHMYHLSYNDLKIGWALNDELTLCCILSRICMASDVAWFSSSKDIITRLIGSPG